MVAGAHPRRALMLFFELVACSRAVGETRSRKQKVALLVSCLRALEPTELEVGVAFLSGRLRQGRIGLGYATAMRGQSVAPASAPSLTLEHVDRVLADIGATSGRGSSKARLDAFGGLLARATAPEQEFLLRLLVGEVRQGALEGVLVEAVAAAADVASDALRRAHMLSGDLGEVALAAFRDGAAGLARFRLELFRPLQPMLAELSEEPAAALAELGEAVLDDKIDGARIQVHKAGELVRVYSRHLKEVTPAVPEVVEWVRGLESRELILDGEVVALGPDGRPHPFQTTMRRFGRKLDVARMRGELPLTPFFFDCLHVDGETLLDRPARERFRAMPELLGAPSAGASSAGVVRRIVTADVAEADAFLDAALARGHEGIMAKALDAPYAAGHRGAAWRKIKPVHTLDLVVLAAEWGHGRRQGWLSNLHLGARNPDGSFTMLGKTFKGMTDAMLSWQTERFQQLALGTTGSTVHLRPELVVEVAVADIQTSPKYPGGLALRLARVKRYREDKTAAEADTLETVRRIHVGREKKR